MKAEFEKCMLIANELIAYCHLRGADEYHLDYKIAQGVSDFIVKAAPTRLTEDELDALREKLNAPRQREVEQEYWDIMGESETSCELTLVGMLCDEALAGYKNGELTLILKRLP